MRYVLFYHSLVSDWNHGNAHFLRGVMRELLSRGHEVVLYEPRDGWSRTNLLEREGAGAVRAFERAFPNLSSEMYDEDLDLDQALRGADVVIVHEWNEPELVAALGRQRTKRPSLRMLFHDTHHRSVSAPEQMAQYDLRHYDGVLAFGDVVRDLYLENTWARDAWTWHEAADPRHYRPLPEIEATGDLVWIGNWGDGERTEELERYLFEPIRRLGIDATVCGVNYPKEAIARLEDAGASYAGWAPATGVVRQYARHHVTVHVPRRFYSRQLPGIPTIRVFEALACGIPLVCSPWDDAENLFTPGEDYLVARDSDEMTDRLRELLDDPIKAREQAQRGRSTVLARHTCAHRVTELEVILDELEAPGQ